jgi:amino acid transporter
MPGKRPDGGHGFGTMPVFLASVSTILGAVLFLRFGYAVGHLGLAGTLLVIVIGHLVTIPTALAIAEIATNRRVEGGGEYFIISRSFGRSIGGTIGVSLYLSQAVSVAFYMIAFAEAFRPLAPWFEARTGVAFDPRFVSLPATVALSALVVTRGAALGVKALLVVVGTLAVSLLAFSLGSPVEGFEPAARQALENPDPFILVFAIVFPAFTGMTAGVGLSGDLANPRKSIPLGVMSATVVGMVMYVWIAWKLWMSAPPEVLAGDELVMSQVAVWGPIIPIGLAAATLSSALGSILVAPRTLQALAADRVLPLPRPNRYLSRGEGPANEPRHATLVTAALALVTVALGNVDFVARIISMFFMVTYGALCLISAFEHFAARPSYRPSFRSKWYLSVLGAVMCGLLMFQMDPVYALLAVAVMTGLYLLVRGSSDPAQPGDLAAIFQGVISQATRHSHIKLQATTRQSAEEWRPSVVMVNGRTFSRTAPIQFFSWLCHRYGFGAYLHHIPGVLNRDTHAQSRQVQEQLVRLSQGRASTVYVDTLVAPTWEQAVALAAQLPGVAGIDNNTLLFEIGADDPPDVALEAWTGAHVAATTGMNSLVLRHGPHFFGGRETIHLWLTWHDYRNASLMILLSYILLGHPDWEEAEIRIFAAFPQDEVDEQRRRLLEMVNTGRLPISAKNLRIIPTDDRVDFRQLVEDNSATADLVVFGFTESRIDEKGPEVFLRHPGLRDVLFVSAEQDILIV